MFDTGPPTDRVAGEPGSRGEAQEQSTWPQYFLAVSVVVGITLPALFVQQLVGHRAIALIYLLGVVVMALFVGRGPTLLAATMSALFWDFFFLAPITHLRIADVEDAILFGMYFVVALVLGQLTARIRAQEKARRQGEEWVTALYRLTRELAEATDLDQLLQKVVRQMECTFGAQVVVLLPDSSQRLSYHAHPASTYDLSGPEQPVAEWVFEHGQPAGRFADHLSQQADTLFVPLTTGSGRMGVMGLGFSEPSPPTVRQRELLDAFTQQIAQALDQFRLREGSEKARLLAESERLSKTLLDSMSHEIRTPVAAIKSATSNLVELKAPELSAAQQQMIAEIQEANERLDRLVGKVLDISRLESGRVKPKLAPCDINDLVHVAVKETRKELARHKVIVQLAPGLPLVRVDFVLVQQALMNLLSNAAAHTPPGTAVQVTARVRDGALLLVVADRGPGIPPDALPRVFDKFYRGPAAPTGGTGLGLSLVKGFVEAQAGQVTAENRPEGGAVFTIRLPLNQTRSAAAELNV